jgi:hypothetical protein
MRPLALRLALLAAPIVLAAGCASVPTDELTWSSALARSLPMEDAAVVEVARFSRHDADGWEPYLVFSGNTPTDYRLDGEALHAESREGGSGMWRKIRIDVKRHPVIEWRWRVPPESAGAASAKSPPVRISLGFHGDPGKLDVEDRVKLRMARAMTVHGLPYASLLYVWRTDLPEGSLYSHAQTERVRHIVVESGEARVGHWVSVRRNVLEDYRRAFGEEPGDLVAVGVMTDYGDDGSPRRAQYGDIIFQPGPGAAHAIAR